MKTLSRILLWIGFPIRVIMYCFAVILLSLLGLLRTESDFHELREFRKALLGGTI